MKQMLLTRSSQSENHYGPFTSEILSTEGLTGFESIDVDVAGWPELGAGDVVILTRCFLYAAEIESLWQAVSRGARLVCFFPSPRLAQRFGWKSERRVAYPGWVRIRAGYPGAGPAIQAHVPVALFNTCDPAAACMPAADAVMPDGSQSASPAVVQQDVGSGKVVFFFYDLPHAIARIRFGNPDLSSVLTLGWPELHAGDLFAGQVDERVRHLPQADFHAQLLARVLADIAAWPMPRLWYYPEAAHRSVAILQSDDDNSTEAQFRELSDCVVSNGGRITFYLMKDTQVSPPLLAELRRLGHTFAPHINAHNSGDEWSLAFPEAIREETALFRERHGACSGTLQCHCGPWKGYMDWVPAFRDAGYRLLFAYISLPAELWHNYMCGSGRPMRFFDGKGVLHDCLQQPLVIYDDGSLIDMIRDQVGELLRRFDAHLADVLERTHTALPFLSHPVSFATYSRPFMEACFERLRRAGVPILNGDEWLDFIDRRARVKTLVPERTGTGWRHRIAGLRGTMTLMLPVQGKAAGIRVMIDNVPSQAVFARRLEQDYLFVQLSGTGQPIVVETQEGGSAK